MNEVDTFQSKHFELLELNKQITMSTCNKLKQPKRLLKSFSGSKIEQQTTLVIANMDCFSKQMISFARK
jgi:hypothetical protein